MKKIFPIVFLLLFSATLFAQDYLSGKLSDPQWGVREIFYDRTQNGITANIFQTVYKVFETNKIPLYTITITHDRSKQIILMAVKQYNGNSKGTTITYDEEEHGLIFTERNSTDTAFLNFKLYKYLLSFTDAQLDYPVAHEVRTEDGKIIELDPLTKLRLRKQKEIIQRLAPLLARSAKDKYEKARALSQGDFNQHLLQLRDSLYVFNTQCTFKIEELRNSMDKELAAKFESRKFEKDSKFYSGEKKKGKPNGKGLLVENGNVYEGNFKAGTFLDGRAVLKIDSSDYTGEYANSKRNGIGWLKFANGTYLLGTFSNGNLSNGISLSKEASGELYFGGFANGTRNGYGELHNTKEAMYFGEFQNGKLVKGFSKEVDTFGYTTYSKINDGNKTAVDAALAEDFFDSVLSAQK